MQAKRDENTKTQQDALLDSVFKAIENNDLSLVKTFMKNEYQTSERKKDRNTPIYLAASHKHWDIISYLIDLAEKSPTTKPTPDDLSYVIFIVVLFGQKTDKQNLIPRILKLGANLEYETEFFVRNIKYQGTLLNMACILDDSWLAELLICCGANVNALITHTVTNTTYTNIHWIVGHRNKKILTQLLAHGADFNIKSCGETVIKQAINNDYTEIVEILLEADRKQLQKRNINPLARNKENLRNDVTPFLFDAIKTQNLKMVRLLADKYNQNVTGTGKGKLIPIAYAMGECFRADIVEYLFKIIEKMPEIRDSKDEIRENFLKQLGYIIAQILMRREKSSPYIARALALGVDLERYFTWTNRANQSLRGTALHYAVLDENISLVSSLISLGADIEARITTESDVDAGTPLHCAVKTGNLACVTLLLKAGANYNANSKTGETPFALATRLEETGSSFTACRKLLIETEKNRRNDLWILYLNFMNHKSLCPDIIYTMFGSLMNSNYLAISMLPSPEMIRSNTKFIRAGLAVTAYKSRSHNASEESREFMNNLEEFLNVPSKNKTKDEKLEVRQKRLKETSDVLMTQIGTFHDVNVLKNKNGLAMQILNQFGLFPTQSVQSRNLILMKAKDAVEYYRMNYPDSSNDFMKTLECHLDEKPDQENMAMKWTRMTKNAENLEKLIKEYCDNQKSSPAEMSDEMKVFIKFNLYTPPLQPRKINNSAEHPRKVNNPEEDQDLSENDWTIIM